VKNCGPGSYSAHGLCAHCHKFFSVIEYLFDRFDKLRQPPFQPKWKEMNLAGTIHSWKRYPAAQELLDKAARAAFDQVLARAGSPGCAEHPAEQERLFQQFREWSKQQKRH